MPDALVPPWADGSFTLTEGPAAPQPHPVCATAQFISTGYWGIDAHHGCAQGGLLFIEDHAFIKRTDLSTLLTDIPEIWPHEEMGAYLGCQGDSVTLAIFDHPTQSGAIVQFGDLARPGVVRWSTQSPNDQGVDGFVEFAASSGVLAWIWLAYGSGQHLYVSDGHGENVRELSTVDHLPYYLQADGTRLVYIDNRDIWLWDAATPDAPPVNLTNDAADQFYPWLSGDRLVWVDERDGGGTLYAPNNPEIYSMVLSTRTVTRITGDPPSAPVLQFAPMVAGDWVVWQDYRHASEPNPGSYNLTDRGELYGYNFVTQREYPVMTGLIRAAVPLLVGNRVYFACTEAPPSTATATFMVPLPTP